MPGPVHASRVRSPVQAMPGPVHAGQVRSPVHAMPGPVHAGRVRSPVQAIPGPVHAGRVRPPVHAKPALPKQCHRASLMSEASQNGAFLMKPMKMSEGGRVVVPSEIRKALNVREGDTVYWDMVDGEARLTTKLARLRRSQAIIEKHCSNQQSVVEEFIAERRREAEFT